jgi:hypothetical protein
VVAFSQHTSRHVLLKISTHPVCPLICTWRVARPKRRCVRFGFALTLLHRAVCPILRLALSVCRRQAKYALCRPIKRDRAAKRNREFESNPLLQPVWLSASLL